MDEYKQHPSCKSALKYIASQSGRLMQFRETCASTAIEGNELGSVLADTINRIIAREPVGERFVLALAFELQRTEKRRQKQMTELITPCPACGKMPFVDAYQDLGGFENYRVVCDNGDCPIEISSLPHPSENKCIEQWESAFGPKHPDGDLVPVRIAIAVDINGKIGVMGIDDNTNEQDAVMWAMEGLEDYNGLSAVSIITTRAPRPKVQEIKGEVVDDDS